MAVSQEIWTEFARIDSFCRLNMLWHEPCSNVRLQLVSPTEGISMRRNGPRSRSLMRCTGMQTFSFAFTCYHHKSSHVLLRDTVCNVQGRLYLVRGTIRANSPDKVEDIAGSVTWTFTQTPASRSRCRNLSILVNLIGMPRFRCRLLIVVRCPQSGLACFNCHLLVQHLVHRPLVLDTLLWYIQGHSWSSTLRSGRNMHPVQTHSDRNAQC